jgi:predicted alpha/beta hydrolase
MQTLENAATFPERRLTLQGRDGFPLAATLFEPTRARANLVVLGALAVPQSFYARFARAMAASGLRVLTLDYRGVGGSEPARLAGFRADLEDWAELDAPAAFDFVRREYGDLPTFALGHSLGGQVLALDEASRATLAGAFLVASQSGFYGTFQGRGALVARLFWFGLLPAATRTFDYLPGWVGLGADIPRGVAEQWCDWCKSEDYYLSTHPHYARALASFERPIHALSFTDDWYAPRANVDWLLGRYSRATVHHEHLSPRSLGASEVGHFGFFSSRMAAKLWPRVGAFVAEVMAARSQVCA